MTSVARLRPGVFFALAIAAIGCGGPRPRQTHQNDSSLPLESYSRFLPLRWSPDGLELSYLRIDQVVAGDAGTVDCDSTGLYAVGTHSRALAVGLRPELCAALALSPGASLRAGGARIILEGNADRGPAILELNLDDQSKSVLVAACVTPASAPVLSPSGDRIAFVGRCGTEGAQGTLLLADSDGVNIHTVGAAADTSFYGVPSWAADENRIAITQSEGSSAAVTIAVLDLVGRVTGTLAFGHSPSWNPTEDWIAYLASDGLDEIARSIRIVRSDGSSDHEVWRLPGAIEDPQAEDWISGPLVWSPDGHRLAFARRSSLWELQVQGAVSRLLAGGAVQPIPR